MNVKKDKIDFFQEPWQTNFYFIFLLEFIYFKTFVKIK